MTTGVGGDESWGEGSREEDVQLNDDDLFEEYHPPELKNAGEDPPSEGINGEATNEYPQGLFGTTPPTDGRQSKVQKRKFHKKLSPTVAASTPSERKRPYSVIAPSTLDKNGEGERRRRNTDSYLGTTAEQPVNSKSNLPEGKLTHSKSGLPMAMRKDDKNKDKRKKKKKSQDPSKGPLSRRLTLPDKHTAFSFQSGEHSLPADLHMNRPESTVTMTLSHRFTCPPERKRFYRSLLQSLKRTTGFAAIMGSGAVRKLGEHRQGTFRRGYSENLALTNPYGQLYDQIWLELRAYLYDQPVDELNSQIFFRTHEVDRVLSRVSDFRCSGGAGGQGGALLLDCPSGGGSGVFSREASSQPSEGGVASRQSTAEVSSDPDDGEEVGGRGGDTEGGAEPVRSLHQSSCEETKQFTREVFLSACQLSALSKVEDILAQLEEAGSWFPNSGRMGQTHPKFRSSHFSRRVEALTLWHKVTVGLADCLSRLSSWVGVQVTTPTGCMCVPPTEPSTAASDVMFVIGRGGREEEGPDDVVMNSLAFNFSRMHTTSSSGDSGGYAFQRLFNPTFSAGPSHGPYHVFVDRALKTSGLKELMKALQKFISPSLVLAKYALSPLWKEDAQYEERVPLLRHYLPPTEVGSERTQQPQMEHWVDEFTSMNLPMFVHQYIQLLRVPLDVMHDCLNLQLALKPPQDPSTHSVKQLVVECRMTLEEAIAVYSFYNSMFEPACKYFESKDVAAFDEALGNVLNVYFDYVRRWVLVFGPQVLEDEWINAKKICSEIKGKEAEAGRMFCGMVTQLLERTADMLQQQLDECNESLHHLGDELQSRQKGQADWEDLLSPPHSSIRKKSIGEVCHSFKSVFVQMKERTSKLLGFARLLCKDLEIATEFQVLDSTSKLMEALQNSQHHQVLVSNQISTMLFVPEAVASNHEEIQKLLDASLGIVHDPAQYPSHYFPHESYLLLVEVDKDVSTWQGKNVPMDVAFETTIAVSKMEVHGLKMIVKNSQDLSSCRSLLLDALGSSVSTTNKQTSSHENVAEQISDLKKAAWMLGQKLMNVSSDVMNHLSMEGNEDKADLNTHYHSMLLSCFNLGFEYIRELFRLLGEDLAYEMLGKDMLLYAQLWMRFVVEHCERGRGRCPQWAMIGLDFVCLACAPCVLAIISFAEFEVLKKQVKRCQEHLFGSPYNYLRTLSSRGGKDSPDSPGHSDTPPFQKGRRRRGGDASRKEEPILLELPELVDPNLHRGLSHSVAGPPKSQLFQVETKVPLDFDSVIRIESEDSSYLSPGLDSPVEGSHQLGDTEANASPYHQNISWTSVDVPDDKLVPARMKVIREKTAEKDMKRDKQLRADKMIGQAVEAKRSSLSDLSHIAQVHYRWTRGRKLGEGKFGMVYECFNRDTTECHAVKQLKIAYKDYNTIKEIIDEIGFYQKLNHPNIVKFYGVEIMKNDLYLFMEYCNEGTLWSLAQQGLTEPVMRLYTRDILKAVYEIHRHNIVHRDIKGANIFMSSNTVKLGDFGLSVQLKYGDKMLSCAQHDAGTVPYMSPEVIKDRDVKPPMDIWSVGCVLVEMATRKMPWSECDNTFQVLYQIGIGNYPKIDKGCLSAEGINFLSHCFEIDPLKRWTAGQLRDHPFVKVCDEQ